MQTLAIECTIITHVIFFWLVVISVLVLQRGRPLEGNSVEEIFRIMSNDHAMKILQNTYGSPKSARQISRASKIPLTQVYRWIRRLYNVGFLRISGDTNSFGKKFFMYQSKIGSIKISLNSSLEPQIEIS